MFEVTQQDLLKVSKSNKSHLQYYPMLIIILIVKVDRDLGHLRLGLHVMVLHQIGLQIFFVIGCVCVCTCDLELAL